MDVTVSRTKRISAFHASSWCQTCDVVRSRCWMSLSSFGCPGENALHYKEWSTLSNARLKRKTQAHDWCRLTTKQQTFSLAMHFCVSVQKRKSWAGFIVQPSSRLSKKSIFVCNDTWCCTLNRRRWSLSDGAFFILNFEADGERPNDNARISVTRWNMHSISRSEKT